MVVAMNRRGLYMEFCGNGDSVKYIRAIFWKSDLELWHSLFLGRKKYVPTTYASKVIMILSGIYMNKAMNATPHSYRGLDS